MIKYSLICSEEHNFEAWFSDSKICDEQIKKSIVECPLCGSKRIKKTIMAPNIPSKGKPMLIIFPTPFLSIHFPILYATSIEPIEAAAAA